MFRDREILDRTDLVVEEELMPVHVARKAAHFIVERDDIRIERADQIVQRGERRDLAAGGDVDVHAGRSQGTFRDDIRDRYAP